MSKYRIILEDKIYEMEIDLIEKNVAGQAMQKKEYKELKNVAPPTVRTMAPAAQIQNVSTTGIVAAPIPGTVINVKKEVGDLVKAGETVLILEAMKMENDILAPVDGTIKIMNCALGGTVAGGEVLFEIG